MKNILLATILLSTIACNGSGGGGPKVDVGPEKTTFTYSVFDDVIDTDLNPCGFGETKYEDDNTITICNTKGEDRPFTNISYVNASLDVYRINCVPISNLNELKTCTEIYYTQYRSFMSGIETISDDEGTYDNVSTGETLTVFDINGSYLDLSYNNSYSGRANFRTPNISYSYKIVTEDGNRTLVLGNNELIFDINVNL